tara:strand:- start:482 stop:583 length:102 start_codon:yes stop_codon:yes gene_type:complete
MLVNSILILIVVVLIGVVCVGVGFKIFLDELDL